MHLFGMYLWYLFQFVIGYNLITPILLLFFFKIRRKIRPISGITSFKPDYAVIVTAYEEVANLEAVVDSLLKMDYPEFTIYIVADCCDITNLRFENENVVLLKPEVPLKGNIRSHFYAINRFRKPHERITIIDSDNLVQPDYLSELNVYFDLGYSAIQGTRAAKNLNTTLAALDAARDIYYHFYDGKLLFEIGSSATLAGSGMAFKTSLYVNALSNHEQMSGAGFDKVLQFEIVRRGYRIAFAEKAKVYDEKTSHSSQLINQRSRWINTWFKYFKYGFNLIAMGIKRFDLNQFLFGIVLLRPPLFMFLIVSAVCALTDLFINPWYTLVWLLAFTMFIFGFIKALLSYQTDKKIYQSLKSIPFFIYYQIVALFGGSNKKENIATRHG